MRVRYPAYYDLVFRCTHGGLRRGEYFIDFEDWVKAGVAFNALGYVSYTRSTDYFASVYYLLNSVGTSQSQREYKVALRRFYEDILDLYVRAINSIDTGDSDGTELSDLKDSLFIPQVSADSPLNNYIPARTIVLDEVDSSGVILQRISNLVALETVLSGRAGKLIAALQEIIQTEDIEKMELIL